MASSGPRYATAQNGNPGDFGGDDWTKLNADDGVFNNYSWPNGFDGAGSDFQGGRALGFSIPAGATITGIAMDVKGKGSGMNIGNVNLSKTATTNFFTTQYAKNPGTVLTATSTNYTYGSSSDLWGRHGPLLRLTPMISGLDFPLALMRLEQQTLITCASLFITTYLLADVHLVVERPTVAH